LGNVTVSDYEDASGGAKLSLSYQQVALTTKAINLNGSLGGSQTFSPTAAMPAAHSSKAAACRRCSAGPSLQPSSAAASRTSIPAGR
jgi:hypothetical protein